MEARQSVDERADGFAVPHVKRLELRALKRRDLARSVDLARCHTCRKHTRAQRQKAFRDRCADARSPAGDENLAPLKETRFQGIGCFQSTFSE